MLIFCYKRRVGLKWLKICLLNAWTSHWQPSLGRFKRFFHSNIIITTNNEHSIPQKIEIEVGQVPSLNTKREAGGVITKHPIHSTTRFKYYSTTTARCSTQLVAVRPLSLGAWMTAWFPLSHQLIRFIFIISVASAYVHTHLKRLDLNKVENTKSLTHLYRK